MPVLVHSKSEIKNKTSGFIFSKIGNSTSKPVVLMTPNYVKGGNREYMLMSGIYEYNNVSKVHLKLGFSSGGIKLNINSNGGVSNISSFTPNKFNIDEAYIFGSVKHNGKWQGIRMYIE